MAYHYSIWPLVAILVSLLATLPILAFNDRRPNLRESSTLMAAVAKFMIVAAMIPVAMQGGGFELTLAEVIPGVPIQLRVDALGLIFALVASFLWIFTSLYSIGYM